MGTLSLVGADSAGGAITGPGAPTWTWDGKKISLLGDMISPHGLPPHNAPVIVTGSPWWSIDGIPVTRVGSIASCGHGATGSPPVDIP